MDLPDDYLINVSVTSYSNDKLTLDWLQHFNRITEKRTKGAWCLLLVDRYNSLETKEFCKFTEDHKNQLFHSLLTLPTFSSHLMRAAFRLLNGAMDAAWTGQHIVDPRT
jgi:hypothetical protein